MPVTAGTSGRIQEHETFVQVDLGGCGLPELLALCTEFAALCVTARVRCALLQGGDEDMQRCLAVRDLLKTILLVVGVPKDFRLALVPGTPRTRAVYQKSEAELRGAGLDARCFESEDLATQWFRGSALLEARA
jgi:hypothetical protein